jgi:protein-tyrosine-phosphatase
MPERIYNVLFLCTGNSARSILAEAIMNQDAAGRMRAFSAGSFPKGAVNPLALKVLRDFGYPVEGLSSKSWDMFAAPGAACMDFIVTVCDNAAGEVCPVWPGRPLTAHWGVQDPAAIEGTDGEGEAAFVAAFQYMKDRISTLLGLPLPSLSVDELGNLLQDIGRRKGASLGVRADSHGRGVA